MKSASVRHPRRHARYRRAVLAAWLLMAQAASALNLHDSRMRWQDDAARPFAFETLRGREVVLTMAYAGCSRICSTSLSTIALLQQRADEQHREVDFVIVGYNPELEGPQTWARYRRQRGLTRANWHFVTGSPDDTHRLAQRLGIEYWLYDEHVMHDFKLLHFDRSGELIRAIGWDQRGETLF